MKKIITLLILLTFIPSLSYSDVIGKGLICNRVDGYQDYPYYYYFEDQTYVNKFKIEGYDIKTLLRKYRLNGTKNIEIENFGTLNRETMEVSGYDTDFFGKFIKYSCQGYGTKESVLTEVRQFIKKGKLKNKF